MLSCSRPALKRASSVLASSSKACGPHIKVLSGTQARLLSEEATKSALRMPDYKRETVAFQKTLNQSSQPRLIMQLFAAANRSEFNRCLRLASQMKMAGMSPDISVYNALMSVMGASGMWLHAWAILDDMMLVGINPDVTTFNHLLRAQRFRSPPNSLTVLHKMDELEIPPNAITFDHIITRYASVGNLELALDHFFKMRKLNLTPELKTMDTIVCFAAAKGCPRLAIDIATWFEQNSVRRLPESAWIDCLVSSAEQLYADGVMFCWETIVRDFKINPDEGICLAVLHTAARHGLPDLATDALRVLKTTDVKWEERHIAPLVEAFCRSKQLKEAILVFDIMRANEIEPDDGTAYPIYEAVKEDTEAVDKAWALIDELHQNGRRVDLSVVKAIIRASVALKDLQRAVGAFRSFTEYGLTPDLATYNLLLDGCIVTSHRELGDVLLSEMKAAKIKPDEVTYEKLIELCLTQETYEDAFFYLEEMKASGFVPPPPVYYGLVQRCINARDERYTIALQEMGEFGYSVTATLRRSIKWFEAQANKSNDMNAHATEEVPLLDGAAQRFIETGGLSQTPGRH